MGLDTLIVILRVGFMCERVTLLDAYNRLKAQRYLYNNSTPDYDYALITTPGIYPGLQSTFVKGRERNPGTTGVATY
jgi:hypothetical protein